MNTEQFANRRQFIITLGSTAAAMAAGSLLIDSCTRTTPEKGTAKSHSGNTITLDLADPRYALLSSTRGAVKIPDPNNAKHSVIVGRNSSGDLVAFSSRCTHKGCELPLPENNLIVCPCHGASFDGDGKVLGGPAEQSLKRYNVDLKGATVTIQL